MNERMRRRMQLMRRVDERVNKELDRANRYLAEKYNIDPTDKNYRLVKEQIRLSYERDISLDEANGLVREMSIEEKVALYKQRMREVFPYGY